MSFDDIISGSPKPAGASKIVHVEIEVEVYPPWADEPDDIVQIIGQETAARHLMYDTFDQIPILRETLAESLVDMIGQMPVNSTWTEIVDMILDRIFWK